jgi:exo-1,4-beta-D-glucosaminidase
MNLLRALVAAPFLAGAVACAGDRPMTGPPVAGNPRVVASAAAQAGAAAAPAQPLVLSTGWALQTSARVKEGGDVLSTEHFHADDWYPLTVPSTVLAALVADKVYPPPYFGMNLRSYPGMGYPIGKNYSNQAMPADSPWAVPWWYRTQFTIPVGYKDKAIWLKFGGINYRANIWFNGKQIASEKDCAGALRTYEFNVTDSAKPGAENVLAVQVRAPGDTDLGITFVDWNPAPPDKSMGLWREVMLTSTGPVAIRYPAVISHVNSPANDRAQLTVTALLRNAASHPVRGKLRGRIETIDFEQDVELGAGEEREVAFEPQKFPSLTVANPRLWWPRQMGTPNLYDLDLRFETGGEISDSGTSKFGIREIKAELDGNKNRLVTVNGKKILIRGAGYSSDILLTYDAKHVEDQLDYVQDMGLNTIRLEGKLEPDHFFEAADRRGLLVIAGWCCCDHWEHWDKWKADDHRVAEASLRSQIYRLRGHPSLAIWMNGSDNPPAAAVEEMYLRVERELRWPNGIVSNATEQSTPVSGESGVKMTGPYEWVAPQYWLEDTAHGGAFGFNTETSPGPAPPPIESLRAMLPPDKLWPRNDTWDFHAGGNVFKNINIFADALSSRYGKPKTVEDFALKSQLMAYEGIRAMFEAYSRNKYTATGVVQWMLNNAWPSLIWHLYDYYMRPGGGYFGAKQALEPLHPVYGYHDRSVWVVNSTYEDVAGLKLTAKVLNLDASVKFTTEASVDIAADGTKSVLTLPVIRDVSPTYFVKLTLRDRTGKIVGSNLYWASSKPEKVRYDKSEWYTTPTASFADFTALAQLPKVHLEARAKTSRDGGHGATTVTLSNPTKSLAFFVRLKLDVSPGGDEILPVTWEDNYVTLLPGETREITARYDAASLGPADPVLEVSGYNVQ